MFKSIFSKLVTIFIAVLIFSFSITSLMLYFFLGNLVIHEKEEMLKRSGREINRYFSRYAENSNNPLIYAFFQQVLEEYSSGANAIIWIVRTDGSIWASKPDLSSNNPYMRLVRKSLNTEDPDIPRLADERQYKDVMAGKDPLVKIGDFYGLFKETKESWLTVEYPLTYNDSTIAAVYLMTPVPEIHKTRESVFRFFMLSVLISVLVSVVLVYIFSRKLIKPLKEINDAARVISGGEFTKRLDIRSQDEIGELAMSFNQMITALENLEEMRRGFIANVSHELRTPMTSIRGFIEGMLDGTIPPEKHKDYLAIVKEETIRLNRLVNDLLDLARMESGESKVFMRTFDINELIRRSIIKLEKMITDKDISVDADFEEEEIFVHADSDMIERVIINLIHNGVKFTGENGKISISTRKQKDKVLISIHDDGVGIEKNELAMIWDRFYKSDKSRSMDKSGTGLGLAIVKNLINSHGQEIWVDSEPGKGTRFTFTLSKGKEKESKEL